MAILSVVFLGIHLVFFFLLFFLVIAFVTGAPFVPTTRPATRSMMRLAAIRKGEKVIDLGSGDGRLLLEAMKTGAGQAVGYEINPYLVLYANLRTLASVYRGKTWTRWQNLWSADISGAEVIFVYLIPWKMKKLEEKILAEARPGTRIISNSFLFKRLTKYAEDPATHIYAFRR